jgi:murein DD-endopeptidase MepM/ murein hydrolase activator NlpD
VFLPIGYARASESAEVALEPGVSNFSITQDKIGTDSIDSSSCANVTGGALAPCLSNSGTIDGDNNGEAISDQISVYVIRKGDSIAQIAEMYDVSANTILWANDMKKGDKLVEGNTLVILPVDGISYTVVKGDTLKKIAEKYKADVFDITSFNDISIDTQLSVGQELIVPNAEVNTPSAPKVKTKTKTSSKNYDNTPTQNVSGYFINPVPNYVRRSQGLHDRRGVDLAAPTGTTIVAAASGTVLVARKGYNGGYGNMVIIQHPNGTKTLYGHMSQINTRSGAHVGQGEKIGEVGSTGHSTGPHLHIEVFGAKNPGATTPMSWARR